MLGMRSKDPVKTHLVLSLWGNESRKAPQEIEGRKENFGITGGVRLAQLETHFALGGQREAFLGKGRPHAVAPWRVQAPPLLFSVMGSGTKARVEGKANVMGAERLRRLRLI